VACAAFLTVGAGAQPAILAASTQYVTFGMVGLSTGQTARLNALALPTGGPIIAGASCQVTFDFYDAAGKSLGTSTATVAQGAAVHDDLVGTSADRAEIRGTVRAALVSSTTGGTPVSGSCSVLPTLEIFDSSTGQTTVVLQQTTALSAVTPL
jgi:hypothetical protein